MNIGHERPKLITINYPDIADCVWEEIRTIRCSASTNSASVMKPTTSNMILQLNVDTLS